MATSNLIEYNFALIRYMDDPNRGETLNIGVVVRDKIRVTLLWNHLFHPEYKIDHQKWHFYFIGEFIASPYHISTTEEFWDSVRGKLHGKFILGPTRKHFENKTLDQVADTLFTNLVSPRDEK